VGDYLFVQRLLFVDCIMEDLDLLKLYLLPVREMAVKANYYKLKKRKERLDYHEEVYYEIISPRKTATLIAACCSFKVLVAVTRLGEV